MTLDKTGGVGGPGKAGVKGPFQKEEVGKNIPKPVVPKTIQEQTSLVKTNIELMLNQQKIQKQQLTSIAKQTALNKVIAIAWSPGASSNRDFIAILTGLANGVTLNSFGLVIDTLDKVLGLAGEGKLTEAQEVATKTAQKIKIKGLNGPGSVKPGDKKFATVTATRIP